MHTKFQLHTVIFEPHADPFSNKTLCHLLPYWAIWVNKSQFPLVWETPWTNKSSLNHSKISISILLDNKSQKNGKRRKLTNAVSQIPPGYFSISLLYMYCQMKLNSKDMFFVYDLEINYILNFYVLIYCTTKHQCTHQPLVACVLR